MFAGCARSCAAYLDGVIANIGALSALYERTAVVIFENDSSDDTAARLQAWAEARSDVCIISRPGLAAAEPDRTRRLAIGRNACLDFIRGSAYADFDDLIVLDCDDANARSIAPDSFLAARQFLSGRTDLHGVFANAQPFYYDIWALRHPTWCPGDCWAEVRATGRVETGAELVFSRMIPIDPATAPIEVTSAFGGLGLYKMASALTGDYGDPATYLGPECEHVRFHLSILDRIGGGFAIFPPLTNQTAWEHVLAEFQGQSKVLTLKIEGKTCEIAAPSDHPLDRLWTEFPLYRRRLPMLSRLVSEAEPGRPLISVGAGVGDVLGLCRLYGCTSDMVAVEASLSRYKLLRFNIERNRVLFGTIDPKWGRLACRSSSAKRSSRFVVAEALEPAPMGSLAKVTSERPALVVIDTPAANQTIETSLAFLEDAEPVIWVAARSENGPDDRSWRALLDRLAGRWTQLMAFDDRGLCLLAGATAEHAAGCATLIAAGRRYRQAESAKLATSPVFRSVEIALFPQASAPVFERLRSQLVELNA